jgi:hypothetical protein
MTSGNSASGLVRDERRWGRRGCEDKEMTKDQISWKINEEKLRRIRRE